MQIKQFLTGKEAVTPYHILLLATYLFSVVMYIEKTLPAGEMITLICLVLMLVVYGKMNYWEYRLPRSGYLIYLATFLCFCYFSIAVAFDKMRTFGTARMLTIIFIQMTAVYMCHYSRTKTEDLLRVIMYSGYSVVIYAILRYGFTSIRYVLADSTRLKNDFLNANTLGMCAAYAIVINLYFIIYYKKTGLSVILALPSLFAIAASGSRKALVIMAGGVLMLLMLKNLNRKDILYSLIKIILCLILFAVIAAALLQLPMFSGIMKRMSMLVSTMTGHYTRGTSAYTRFEYVQVGTELFRQNPLFGVGIYNAVYFIGQLHGHVHFHNNFVEMLACGGLTGFVIYYSIYAYILAMFWKLRRYRDSVYDISLVIFCIRLVMGYGHVQFNSAPTYFFLMVAWLEICALRRKAAAAHTVKWEGTPCKSPAYSEQSAT